MIVKNFIFDPDKTIVNFISDLEKTDVNPFNCSITSSGCFSRITYSKLFDYTASAKESFDYITYGGFKKGGDTSDKTEN